MTLHAQMDERRGVAETSPAVAIDRVNVRFETERGTVTALKDVSVTIPHGGFVSLLGPSGCGKSTLLRLVGDLIEPSDGEVLVLGAGPSIARGRREIGFVFQDSVLLPWRTALENVALPLRVGGRSVRANARDPRELLSIVGLDGWENAYPHEMSGGMRQRVSIARALVNDPQILLMDEPFAALDEITRDRLNDELLALWKSTGKTILFVTHSIYEAAFLSSEILILSARPGRIHSRIVSDLPPDRNIAIRETAEFVRLAARLRQGLQES